MQFETITLVRDPHTLQTEIHRQGNLPAILIDECLQRVRTEIGARQETPLDRFLRENDITPQTWETPEGDYHVSMNASWKEYRHGHSLHIAAADGPTPAAARRKLAAAISGKFLSTGLWPPFTTVTQVPDLSLPMDPDTTPERLAEFVQTADPRVLALIRDAIDQRLQEDQQPAENPRQQ